MSLQSPPPVDNVSISDTALPYSFNTTLMAGAIALLFLVIFFILILYVLANWILPRSSRTGRVAAFLSTASVRTNRGLDKAAIAQLPTFVYTASSPVDNLEAGKFGESVAQPSSSECAVCLSEFQENEKGRLLPACKHTFHTECIDMWLFTHSTCPLCRTQVMPPTMAASTETASIDQQHQEQGAMEPSPSTTDGDLVVLRTVEYPCNVVSSQEPSSSSFPISPLLRVSGARALPQVTIDIPPSAGDLLVSTCGCMSAKCTTEQEAESSFQPLKSPSFHASIKRMLSRQSSRHRNSSQEGYEETIK